MNPDRVYRQYRDDALAEQAAAETYATFVAMPFEDSFRYRSTRVLADMIVAAARAANQTAASVGLKPFADPRRAGQPQGAIEITEEILVDVLGSHIFVADLTQLNSNVLLELGVALGMKPSPQILLLLDGDPGRLPFDIKDNNVIRYDREGAVERIAQAFLAAATAFEHDYALRVRELRRQLSSDAIWLMHHLANNPPPVSGDHAGVIFRGATDARLRYSLAEGELIEARVVEMDHTPIDGGDSFATRPTALGNLLIRETWKVKTV